MKERRRLARDVFRSLDGVSPRAVHAFAGALKDLGPPFGQFSNGFRYFAEDLEQGNEPSHLSEMAMCGGLSTVAVFYPSALERLEGVDGPPWEQLREALVAVRDEIAARGELLRDDDLPPALPTLQTLPDDEWEEEAA